MTTHEPTRQPVGAAGSAGGRYATSARTETTVALGPLDGLSPSTRAAVLDDMDAQRERLVLGLEHLREDAERIAAETEGVHQSLAELDQQITVLAPDRAATIYQGPDHVDDVVNVPGHGTFTRIGSGAFADQPYAMRIQVDRELSAADADHLAQLVGYDYSKTGGESLDDPFQDAPNSIVLAADTTKGGAYGHLSRFEESLEDTVKDGSPVYKTDRVGPKGTRLIERLRGVGAVHIYYASVTE